MKEREARRTLRAAFQFGISAIQKISETKNAKKIRAQAAEFFGRTAAALLHTAIERHSK